jgi:hypothetical protein
MANNIRQAVGRSHTVLASAARTTTPDTEELEIPGGTRSMVLVVDTTAAGSSPSTVVKVSGVDRASGKIWDILASAAITATGTVTLSIGPGLPVSANVSANAVVPPVIRITATHGNSTSHTYTIGAHFS